LPGNPGSPEFMEAYHAALAQMRVCEVGKDRSVPGTVSAAIGAYYTSGKFQGLAFNTRKNRRSVLERFRANHGDARISTLTRAIVAVILSKQKPLAARHYLRTLRGLMEFAVEIGLRKDDPTAGIVPAKAKIGKIHPWTEAEIARYEATHPIGSNARLALALLVYTGQRLSDVIGMGPQHTRNGVLFVRQKKTGAEVYPKVHPELARILAASPSNHLTFLVSERGGSYTEGSFGNRFRAWCDEAGLPQCSAHGLRHAAARRLAEAGCTAPEIAAITGHKTLRLVQHYIDEADRVRLAAQAIDKVSGERAANGKVTNLRRRTYKPKSK